MTAQASTLELGEALALSTASEAVQAFRAEVRQIIDAQVAPLVAEAERDRHFPREAVQAFGSAGLFRQRWSGGGHGDLGRCVLLAEEMGWAALGGVGVGVSLHLEAAVAILRRHARTPHAKQVLNEALDGETILCLATSEQYVGSDLSAVETVMLPEGGGWRVRGKKWFVSPGSTADMALVLCRAEAGPALVLVPRQGFTVMRTLETAGMRGLGTARLAVDALLAQDAILVPPGLGLAALTAGLMTERLAITAQVLGAVNLAVSLATTRLRRRQQFKIPLYEHQALRLRMAQLVSEASLARRGLYAMVAELSSGGSVNLCDVAGAKVTAARLGERVVSECMHIFGGQGYLEDETPMARLWRDIRVGRVGAGTDEMMWELVASGLRSDDELYDKWIAGEPVDG